MCKPKNSNFSKTEAIPLLPLHLLSQEEISELTRIFTNSTSYVDNSVFHQSNPHLRLFPKDFQVDVSDIERSWLMSMIGTVEAQPVPSKDKHRLTAHEVKTLFLQFNYARYVVYRLRKKTEISVCEARKLLRWQNISDTVRNKLCVANMSLVVSMAKNCHYVFRSDYADNVFPAGLEGLLLSINHYDIALGWAFSTYACRAIFTHFGRAIKDRMKSYRFTRKDDENDNTGRILTLDEICDGYSIEPVDLKELRRSELNREKEDMLTVVEYTMRSLDPRCRSVLKHCLGISKEAKELNRQLTLGEIGYIYNISRERVRQLKVRGILHIQKIIQKNQKLQLV